MQSFMEFDTDLDLVNSGYSRGPQLALTKHVILLLKENHWKVKKGKSPQFRSSGSVMVRATPKPRLAIMWFQSSRG